MAQFAAVDADLLAIKPANLSMRESAGSERQRDAIEGLGATFIDYVSERVGHYDDPRRFTLDSV